MLRSSKKYHFSIIDCFFTHVKKELKLNSVEALVRLRCERKKRGRETWASNVFSTKSRIRASCLPNWRKLAVTL